MADDLSALSRKLDDLAGKLGERAMQRVLTDVGVKAKADVAEAVRGDLGDQSMSNWRRGRPIQIAGRFDVSGTEVEVTPTPRAGGPMKVLEDGRRAGTSRGRRGRAPRRYGASAGKGTWSDASRLISEHAPRHIAEAVADALRSTFRGS